MQDDADRDRLGRLPGPHLLRSAARVLSIVGFETHTVTSVRASYRSTPSSGIFSSEGLVEAERWLVDQGWLAQEGGTVGPSERRQGLPSDEAQMTRELVRAFILDWPPTWLSVVARGGDVRPELLPAHADEVLGDIFDANERDSLLLAAAAKYDDTALRELGDAGEEEVVSACRSFLGQRGRTDLADRVRRVSLISDALGYDVVAPDLRSEEFRLEVKCYRGPYPSFYLTRNEFEVGSTLPSWRLVLCRSVAESVQVIGWTTLASLRPRLPVETDRAVRWQVVRVRLEESELTPGLPIERSE